MRRIPIRFPAPVQRSSIDLLQAQADTAGIDSTSSPYSFVDDPFVLPTGLNYIKRCYMSREFGRRAALQLAQEWPTLFMFDRDKPTLPAFRPEKPLVPELVEATEISLAKLIAKKQVESAKILFKRIVNESTEISSQIKEKLFELLCYYNGHNVSINETQDWHGFRNFTKQSNKSGWDEDNFAEYLFSALEKFNEHYSTIICGLCKFPTSKSVEKAKRLFDEQMDRGFIPHEEVFNALIRRSKTPQKYLNHMAKSGVLPSVRTINSLLTRINKADLQDNKKTAAATTWKSLTNVLSLMSHLKIEPNLTSFWLFLSAMDRDSSPKQLISALNEVVQSLESREKLIVDEPNDYKLFTTCMKLACNFNNGNLVDRIEQLYSSPTNKVRMASFLEESEFYTHFFNFKISCFPIEETFILYQSLVPRVILITPSFFLYITNRLRANPFWPFIRRIIYDSLSAGFLYSHTLAPQLRVLLLRTDYENMHDRDKFEYKSIVIKLVDGWSYMSKQVFESKPGYTRFSWHPRAIVQCATLLLRVGEKARSWDLFALLVNSRNFEGENPLILNAPFPKEGIDELLNRLAPEWSHKLKIEELDELNRKSELSPARPQHVRKLNKKFPIFTRVDGRR